MFRKEEDGRKEHHRMRKQHMFSWAAIGVLVVLLAACGSGGSGGGGAEGETFVLRGATAWPENDIQGIGFFLLQERVEEASEGRITIEYTGGPESIPPFELGDAVRNGIVDVATISPAYYNPSLPAGSVLAYSELSHEEERENGALDYMNQLHNETLNAQILSRAIGNTSYNIYTREQVDSIEDFQGLSTRVAPLYTPFIQALGAQPVEMPAGEIYQALERGVVNAYTWPEFGITELGWEEQTACKVEPTYWQVDTVTLMNLDRWNELPSDLQELMTNTAIEVNDEVDAEIDSYMDEEEQLLQDAGVAVCEMPEEEYTDIANNSAWTALAENVPSEQAERLQELFRQ